MTNDNLWRLVFGLIAFLLTGAVIVSAISPWVPPSKEQIAMLVLGNVLSWPGVVLAYYFGSSSGSKEKTQALTHQAGPSAIAPALIIPPIAAPAPESAPANAAAQSPAPLDLTVDQQLSTENEQ